MKKKILYVIFVICVVFIAGCGTKENADFVASGNADVDKRVEEIVNYGGVFAYNASFEQIPNYQIDKDNNLIIGSYRRDTNTQVECSYKYDYDTNAFVLCEEHIIE